MKITTKMMSSDGEKYNVADDEMEAFKADFGDDAKPVSRFRAEGADYSVPDDMLEDFKADFGEKAQPLRTVRFANGKTREFTTGELAEFLRSDEYRNGEEYAADREESRAKAENEARVANAGNEPESPSEAFAKELGKSWVENLTFQPGTPWREWMDSGSLPADMVKNANAFAGKMAQGIAETVPAANRVAGRLLGGEETAVGRRLMAEGDAQSAAIQRGINTETPHLEPGVDTANEFTQSTLSTMARFATPVTAATQIADTATQSADMAFEKAMENGASVEKASAMATAIGVLETAKGMLGAKVAQNPFVKKILGNLAAKVLGYGAKAAKMGAQFGAVAGAEDIVQQGVEGKVNPDLWRTGKVSAKEFVSGAAFDLVATGVHGAQHAAFHGEGNGKPTGYVQDLMERPEGRAALMAANPEAAEAVIDARRNGKSVSRKMLTKMGIPDSLGKTVEERNAIGDAFYGDYKAVADMVYQAKRTNLDGQQYQALSEEVAKRVGDDQSEDYGKVMIDVLGEIKDAKELDDPYRREELVGKAAERLLAEENAMAETDAAAKAAEREARKEDAAAAFGSKEFEEQTRARETAEAQNREEAAPDAAGSRGEAETGKERGASAERVEGVSDASAGAVEEAPAKGGKGGWTIEDVERRGNDLADRALSAEKDVDEATRRELRAHYMFETFEESVMDGADTPEKANKAFEIFKSLTEKYPVERDKDGNVLSTGMTRAAWAIQQNPHMTEAQKEFVKRWERPVEASSKGKLTPEEAAAARKKGKKVKPKDVQEPVAAESKGTEEPLKAEPAETKEASKSDEGGQNLTDDASAFREAVKNDPALRKIDAAFKRAKTDAERSALKDQFMARVAELRKQGKKVPKGAEPTAEPTAESPVEAPVEEAKAEKPAAKSAKPAKADAKKAAKVVESFVSKDATRKVFANVHHDHEHGVAVATDGRVLIATKHGYDKNAKDDPDNPYPNWRQVVPNYDGETYKHIERDFDAKSGKSVLKKTELPVQKVDIDPVAVSATCKKVAALANKINNKGTIFAALKLPDGKVVMMDASYLRKVADAMAANGITEIKAVDGKKPILAKNADTTIVAMPTRAEGTDPTEADFRKGRDGNNIVIDALTGRILSAPERSDTGMNSRKWADATKELIERGKKDAMDEARKTALYKAITDAWKNGEKDPRKIYDGYAGEDSFDKLKNASDRELFVELLKLGDKDALAERLAEYEADHFPQFNRWRKDLPREVEKIEKRIAAEDEIDALMDGVEQKAGATKKDGERPVQHALNIDHSPLKPEATPKSKGRRTPKNVEEAVEEAKRSGKPFVHTEADGRKVFVKGDRKANLPTDDHGRIDQHAARNLFKKLHPNATAVYHVGGKDGPEVHFWKRSAGEFANSRNSKYLRSKDHGAFRAKMSLIPHLEQVLENATLVQEHRTSDHPHGKDKNFFKDFDIYKIDLAIPDSKGNIDEYTGRITLNRHKNGALYFYDIVMDRKESSEGSALKTGVRTKPYPSETARKIPQSGVEVKGGAEENAKKPSSADFANYDKVRAKGATRIDLASARLAERPEEPSGKAEAKEPPKTEEERIDERLDLKRMDPKRRSDPKVLAWAKKTGRDVTDGKVLPDAVRAYDEHMTEQTAKGAKRWFPDLKIVTHKYGEKIKRGQHVLDMRDTAGNTLGWFDPKSKEVHLLPGADPETVAHEIMWHGTRDWAQRQAAKGDANAQRLLAKMREVEDMVDNAPKGSALAKLRDSIVRSYTQTGPVPKDVLLNEFGAFFSMGKGGKALEEAVQTAEGRNLFAKGFAAVKELYRDYLVAHGKNGVDLSEIDTMGRDQFVEFIAKQFAGGKTLGSIKEGPELSTAETKAQKARRKTYDTNAPVRDVERDIEKKTGVKIKADDSVEAANALKYGLKEAANIEIQGKLKKFKDTLAKSGLHVEDFGYYAQLKAAAGRDARIDRKNIKRLEERLAAEGKSADEIADAVARYKSVNGSHVDPREAQRLLPEMENGPKGAHYKELWKQLREIIDDTLKTQVDGGLVDKVAAEEWRKEEPDYIPWKNEYDAESGEWDGRGMARDYTRPEHHEAKGRQSAAGDIVAHVFMDHQAAKHRAIENAVRQKLAKLVREHAELGTVEAVTEGRQTDIERNDPNAVTFKEGGVSYVIRLNGTRGAAIANAFTGRETLKMKWADKGFSVFGKKISFRNFSHWSAGMATRYSPTFMVRNMTKDNIELANIVYSERGAVEGSKWMGRYLKSYKATSGALMKYAFTGKYDANTEGGKLIERYIKAGGLIAGGVRAEGMASLKERLSPEAIMKEQKKGRSVVSIAKKYTIDAVGSLNEYAELATRLNVFAAEVASGKTDAEAALFSRRATVDFSRHGDWTPGFNMVRLFSNSTLGATARAAVALGKSKYGKRAALAMFASGMVQGFIEHLTNLDEDERRKKTGEATGRDVSEFERKTSLILVRRGDKVYKVAQHESPFSLISYAGNCMARWICGELTGEQVAKNLGVSSAEMAYNFLPMGSINLSARKGTWTDDLKAAIVSGVVPSALQPVAESAFNVDFKGDRVARMMFNDSDPRSHSGKDRTPDWAKSAAEGLNAMTGGNEGKRGGIDLAPEVVQKLVEGYGKNLMRDVSDALNIGEAVLKRDWSKVTDRTIPVKRDFVKPIDGNDRRYGDALDRYKAATAELSKRREGMDRAEYAAFVKSHPGVADERAKSLAKRIGDLRKYESGMTKTSGKWKKLATPPTEERVEAWKKERRRLQARFLELFGGE